MDGGPAVVRSREARSASRARLRLAASLLDSWYRQDKFLLRQLEQGFSPSHLVLRAT